MTPERHQRIGELFDAPLEWPSSERGAYLERACGGDSELRRAVERLLANHAETGTFAENRPQKAVFYPSEPDHIGPYKIRKLPGEGGMGAVYLAEQDEPIRKEVAIKLIRPGMGSRTAIARFESERRTPAMMDHPNIARVYDAGTTDRGLPYFVMELVEGVPITSYCERQSLNIRQRLILFLRVCEAIQYAHWKGILHRDALNAQVHLAAVLGQEGRKEEAVKQLQLAAASGLNEKTGDGFRIATDPDPASIGSDPRFPAIVAAVTGGGRQ